MGAYKSVSSRKGMLAVFQHVVEYVTGEGCCALSTIESYIRQMQCSYLLMSQTRSVLKCHCVMGYFWKGGEPPAARDHF